MADRKFLIGAEASYGTTATTWRRLQFEDDDHTSAQSELSWVGIGGGALGAPPLDTSVTVAKGGTGTLKCPIYANGLGILNRAAGTTFTSTVVDGGTDAYEQVTTFGASGPPANRSVSVLKDADRYGGTLDHYLYKGGTPTQVEYTLDVDGFAMAAYSLDYSDVTREGSYPTGASSPTTPTIDTLFHWRNTGGPTLIDLSNDDDFSDCVKSIKVTIPLALDTEDWCIGPGAKHRPERNAIPEPSIEITWRYQDPRYFDAYKAGTPFSLVWTMQGPVAIEDTTFPSFTIEVPAFKYDPNDPKISVTEATMQTMPAKVKSNGTDPAVTVTQVTSDTTY